MTTRAAIYARYSTDNQSARSVADQLALCETHAGRLGHNVTARFSDSAISGQMLAQRTGFMALMSEARRPKSERRFDVLIVENADRLTRHPGDIHHIRDVFAFAGVAIIQVDGGELDAIKASVSGLVSQITLASTIEKSRRGMQARAADGLRMGGRLYGYRPVKGEPGVIEIDQDQAAIVRRIFSLFLSGDSPRTIAQKLTREGVPGPRGLRWTGSAIGGWGERGNGVLGNEAYCGVIIWGKVKMFRDPETRKRISRPQPKENWQRVARPDLAIIDAETFAAAQVRRRGRHLHPARIKARYLLSGLLRCPHCGGGLSMKDGSGPSRRVICTNYAESGTCKSGKSFYVARIESAVVRQLRAELDNPAGIDLYVKTYNAERRRLARSAVDDAPAQKAELGRVIADLDRAAQAVISGTMAAATAAPHIARLETRRQQLESVLAAANAAVEPIKLHTGAVQRFRRQLDELAHTIADASGRGHAGPAEAFRSMVTRVTVQPNYDLEIAGNLAPLLGGLMVAGERFEHTPPAVPVVPFIIKAAA